MLGPPWRWQRVLALLPLLQTGRCPPSALLVLPFCMAIAGCSSMAPLDLPHRVVLAPDPATLAVRARCCVRCAAWCGKVVSCTSAMASMAVPKLPSFPVNPSWRHRVDLSMRRVKRSLGRRGGRLGGLRLQPRGRQRLSAAGRSSCCTPDPQMKEPQNVIISRPNTPHCGRGLGRSRCRHPGAHRSRQSRRRRTAPLVQQCDAERHLRL